MAKKNFTLLTVAQAEKLKDESRLFCLNRAEGNLNFNVTDSAGERKVITMPMTFCPIDLSNFAERPMILRNSDFRRLVAKQAIMLIDNDEGEDFITNDPRGKSETAKIYEVLVSGEDPELGYNDGHIDAADLAAKMGLEYSNPFISNIVLRSGSDEDGADLISEVEGKSHLLKLEDFEYIANHSKNSDLKSWAADQVEELRLEEETKPSTPAPAGKVAKTVSV
ncbi:hypothetical protein D3C85_577860 [compost metagenome]